MDYFADMGKESNISDFYHISTAVTNIFYMLFDNLSTVGSYHLISN